MLLAVDTATRMMGLALYDGIRVRSERTWSSNRYHTVELAPAVEQILADADMTTKKLKAVGVATGPGSFTALRIGLAFAKGLAFSEHIPLIGIPTLDIVAAAQPLAEMPLAAVLQAGRKRLSVGWYTLEEDRWQATDKHENLTIDEFIAAIEEPTWVCGELNAEFRKRLSGEESENENVILASPAQSLRRPGYLAALAWERWGAGDVDDPAVLAPFYLHSGDPIPG